MADVKVNYTGRYAIIDTDIQSTDSYLFDGLNGRQGDNGRRVYIQVKDNGYPHDLTGETIELQGKDSKGMTKTTDSMEHVFSVKAGTCSFLVPGAFYQAAGPYQNAYFVIKKTGTDQVVSTIPVSFSVLENAVVMTSGETGPYLAQIDGRLDAVAKRVDTVSTTFNDMLDTINDGASAIGKQVADYMKQLKDGKIATQDGSNTFTGTNHFSNLIVDNWSGSAVDNLKKYVSDQVRAGVGSINLPQTMSRSDISRDYTISNGAGKSSAHDSLMVWKEEYPGVTKMYGVGNVHVDSMDIGQHFHITLPWSVQDGAVILADSFSNYQTKAETSNGGIDVYLYGKMSNQDLWIDFTIAQVH